MAHRHYEFEMPASSAVVFDAFHHHVWRLRWDSLVRKTEIDGGGECPGVGAVTDNAGAGWLALLNMRTRFISFDRPHLAAAKMEGRAFPFAHWAASMRHRDTGPAASVLLYTYSLSTTPRALRWLMEPLVDWAFHRQTCRRFRRLQTFLLQHGSEIEAWQRARAPA